MLQLTQYISSKVDKTELDKSMEATKIIIIKVKKCTQEWLGKRDNLIIIIDKIKTSNIRKKGHNMVNNTLTNTQTSKLATICVVDMVDKMGNMVDNHKFNKIIKDKCKGNNTHPNKTN